MSYPKVFACWSGWRVEVDGDAYGVHVGVGAKGEDALGRYFHGDEIDDLVLALLKAKRRHLEKASQLEQIENERV